VILPNNGHSFSEAYGLFGIKINHFKIKINVCVEKIFFKHSKTAQTIDITTFIEGGNVIKC